MVGNSFWLKNIWKKYGPPDGLTSAVLVQSDESANINEIAALIQQLGSVQVIVAADVKKKIRDQFAVLVQLLGGLGLMTVAVSFFQLFTRFYTLTRERQAEWGLYLAFGASRFDIAAVIVGEAISVSLAGALTGLILGGVLYQTVLTILTSYLSFPFIRPTWQYMTQTALLIIVHIQECQQLLCFLLQVSVCFSKPSGNHNIFKYCKRTDQMCSLKNIAKILASQFALFLLVQAAYILAVYDHLACSGGLQQPHD